jgi:aspartate aminotransferase
MAARAKELEAIGQALRDLSLGEPDFQTLEQICGASVEAVKAGYTPHPAAGGIVDLQKAVAEA